MPANAIKTPRRPARRDITPHDAARAVAAVNLVTRAKRGKTPPRRTRITMAPAALERGAFPARWLRGDVHAPRWSRDQTRAPRPLEPIAATLARVAARGWTVEDAARVVGGLSAPGKMPCPSWSIPASTCRVGGRLSGVEGSTCSNCYAAKGMYMLPNTQAAMIRRRSSLTYATTFGPAGREAFAAAMAYLVARAPVFRWHDSGDIQGAEHLALIVDVARRTPRTRHWLPTRERRELRRYVEGGGEIPSNLVVRVSAPMVGMPPATPGDLPTSGVHHPGDVPAGATECRAYTRGGACGPCRACWRPSVAHVSYGIH